MTQWVQCLQHSMGICMIRIHSVLSAKEAKTEIPACWPTSQEAMVISRISERGFLEKLTWRPIVEDIPY